MNGFIWPRGIFRILAEDGTMPIDNENEALQQGLRYLLGRGVRKSERKARTFLIKAAEAGNSIALNLASEMLANGVGGSFDRATAFHYVKRAADLGNLDAIYSLGYYYLNGSMGNIGYSDDVLQQVAVPRDEAKGLVLLNAAAAQGHGLAAFRIGEYYEEHEADDPIMISRAIEWYNKCASLGEANGLIRLGDFHALGRGVPKDRTKARELYMRVLETDDNCAKSAGKQRLENFEELESFLKETG